MHCLRSLWPSGNSSDLMVEEKGGGNYDSDVWNVLTVLITTEENSLFGGVKQRNYVQFWGLSWNGIRSHMWKWKLSKWWVVVICICGSSYNIWKYSYLLFSISQHHSLLFTSIKYFNVHQNPVGFYCHLNFPGVVIKAQIVPIPHIYKVNVCWTRFEFRKSSSMAHNFT